MASIFNIHEWNNALGKSRHRTDGIHRLLGGEGGVRSAPKLPDGAVLLGEEPMHDTVAEAVDEFIALGHLEGSKEVVIAARESIGGYNHFLLADCHNLRIHIKRF